MRAYRIGVAAIAGLALLCGCASKPKPDAEKPSDLSVRCMAYLGLEKQAGRGDAARLDRASASWRTIALVTMSGPQVDQYYANSIAAYGAQPADKIQGEAATCLKRAPKNKPMRVRKKI
jgi:hypothetical protein